MSLSINRQLLRAWIKPNWQNNVSTIITIVACVFHGRKVPIDFILYVIDYDDVFEHQRILQDFCQIYCFIKDMLCIYVSIRCWFSNTYLKDVIVFRWHLNTNRPYLIHSWCTLDAVGLSQIFFPTQNLERAY